MRRTRKLTMSAVCAAAAVVVLLIGRFLPTGQLSLAAIASLFICAAAIDCGLGWGVLTFAVSTVLGFTFLGAAPIFWVYALLFGYFPIVSLAAERARTKFARYAVLALPILVSAPILYLLKVIPHYTPPWKSALIIIALVVVYWIYIFGYGKLILYYRTRFARRR
ncbi:MAG: hypothetical protein LBN02_09885 [Oscillospiraceae bacterium]|nr:hypothetical protein [Oscillospiraceae bacterium]